MLMLSSESTLASEDQLRKLRERNPATNKSRTHVAIDHADYLDIVYDELDKRNIQRGSAQFGLSKSSREENECMFGLIDDIGITIPSVDARSHMFKGTPISDKERHHLLVRSVEYGVLPSTQLMSVEEEYLREGSEVGTPLLRDHHSDGDNVWRYLQALTHCLQRGGKFKSESSRLEAISRRTQIANRMLQRYCDPNGERLKEYMHQGQFLQEGDSVASSYRYVMGIRNSNNMKFAAGLSIGVAPLVCDNLMFTGEVVIARRHTTNLVTDITKMIGSSLDELLAGSIIAG